MPPQPVGPDWQEVAFDLPPGAARAGLNNLYLHFENVIVPESGAANADITVRSAGQEVGDFGHIFVNGREVSPNRRGYNIALIQPGEPVTAANFDTHLDPSASTALADFIAAAPPGARIAVAAADEAGANLSADAVQALRTTGATADLRGCFRCSHAVIGQAVPAGQTAWEALDPLRPVGVTTGLGLTEPGLAAQVDWIRVEPVKQ